MTTATLKTNRENLRTTDQIRLAAVEARLAELEAMIRGENLRPPTAAPTRIDNDTLYKALDVAAILQCGKTNVYDLIDSGQLAVTRVGTGKGGLRVRGADLATFLDARKEGGPAPKRHFSYLRNLD